MQIFFIIDSSFNIEEETLHNIFNSTRFSKDNIMSVLLRSQIYFKLFMILKLDKTSKVGTVTSLI